MTPLDFILLMALGGAIGIIWHQYTKISVDEDKEVKETLDALTGKTIEEVETSNLTDLVKRVDDRLGRDANDGRGRGNKGSSDPK